MRRTSVIGLLLLAVIFVMADTTEACGLGQRLKALRARVTAARCCTPQPSCCQPACCEEAAVSSPSPADAVVEEAPPAPPAVKPLPQAPAVELG